MASVDPAQINRLLEAGAEGIQLSSLRERDDAVALVAATRYAPAGRRSVSLAHPVAGYGALPLEEAVAGPPPLVVGQIEDMETVDALDDILAAGIDVAFIGTTDLTVDAAFDAERVAARTAEIRKAAASAGVVLGAFTNDARELPDGVGYAAVSSDVSMLRAAMAATARAG